MIADHLITQIGSLLSAPDRQRVLDHVLEHIRLMIGDAAAEEESFRFLEDTSSSDPSFEAFRFIVSLVDHPVWIRRERAAEVLLWLVDLNSAYADLSIDLAFQTSVGFAADVLCGILDILSRDAPVGVWERVRERVDLESILGQVRHSGRFATLYLITKRARDAGSESARVAHARVASMIRDGAIALYAAEDMSLPRWADCITHCWKRLERLDVTTRELRDDLQSRLAAVCHPYGIGDVYDLEAAVSASFRAPARMPLNRWQAKVHFALSTALFPYISVRNIELVTEALCVFSPTAPCRSRSAEYTPPELACSPSMTDYSSLIGEGEFYYLHYYGIHQDAQGQMQEVSVVAVVVPSAMRRRGFVLPDIEATFRSSEHPVEQPLALPHETCCHVIPEFVFFGSFPPAYILPQFQELASIRPDDMRRVCWRQGRAKETEHYGAPYDEGCFLAVRKKVLVLPGDRKLAWIVVIDGKLRAMIDAENNELC
ncbi:MAG: hypothetical protein KJ000_14905 [Pirellulaceae bacterium]|nr:hypothetical protein [Pirellulaceae bacterium]